MRERLGEYVNIFGKHFIVYEEDGVTYYQQTIIYKRGKDEPYQEDSSLPKGSKSSRASS